MKRERETETDRQKESVIENEKIRKRDGEQKTERKIKTE